MPVARVQMPDGRIARLEVPEGTTPEQVESFVFNGMKGQSAAARDTAKFEEKIRKDAAPTALERFGRGVADVTQGLKQGGLMLKDLVTGGDEAGAYTAEKSADLALYDKGRGPDAGIDLMRLGGNLVATAPAMRIPGAGAASLAVRMASGAAQGAAASGAMFTPEGQSKGEQIAVGTLVGGAVPAAFEGVKRAGSGILNRVAPKVADPQKLTGDITIALQRHGIDFGKLTTEAQATLLADAQKAVAAGGTLDDAMLKNKALIESVGAKPTTASITRSPKDWQTEKNLRPITGVGEPILKREQENAAAMVDYLGRLKQGAGGRTAGAVETGESAVTALRTADKGKEQAVSDLYTAFRESGQGKLQVPEARLTASLTNILDEIGQENIPAAVQSRLKDFGFLGGERKRFLTVQEADLFNRLLNANNPGHGPAALTIGRLKGALNESLVEVPGGGELLTKAREAAAQRFAEQRAGSGIGAAVDDVAPDRFVKKFILDAPVRDMRATLAELKKTPQGQQAVRDIKGHVFDTLLLKATGATNADEVAGRAFSGVNFGKALDGIAPEKLHQIFSPDEVGALRTLQKASKLLTEEVPFSDVNHSKTVAALSNLLLKVGNVPVLGQIVQPIIGVGKLGADWVKDANARKEVAEALLASASKAGRKQLPVSGLEKFAPASAAAAVNQPGDDE